MPLKGVERRSSRSVGSDARPRPAPGGQALGQEVGQAGFSDWRHTDAWTFLDSCDTPTTYAIHAVDESGIAAVIGDFTHCPPRLRRRVSAIRVSRRESGLYGGFPWARGRLTTRLGLFAAGQVGRLSSRTTSGAAHR